jgi:hypothetical protein
MRFLTPPTSSTWPRPSCPHRALVFVGAYGGLRIGELAGLRQSRVDLLAGAVTVAEILTEFKGKLIAGRRDAQRRSPCARGTPRSASPWPLPPPDDPWPVGEGRCHPVRD